MHQQIRTSPPGATLAKRLAALRGVSIEGLGPELWPDPDETNHLRFAFGHADMDEAERALRAAGLEPERRPAIVFALSHAAGTLDTALARLTGYEIESVLVLARQVASGTTLVSVGLDRPVSFAEWKRLGGWDEPEEAPPEELTAS